jgi:hypothetical protein
MQIIRRLLLPHILPFVIFLAILVTIYILKCAVWNILAYYCRNMKLEVTKTVEINVGIWILSKLFL